MNILLVTNGTVLGIHHLVVFILLVIIYSKLLRYIREIRKEFGMFNSLSIMMIQISIVLVNALLLEERLPHSLSDQNEPKGAGLQLVTGQSKAKKRIICFLTVFVMTGVISEFL